MHPQNVAQFQTSAETGAPALETEHTITLIDAIATADLPADIEYDSVYSYSDPAAVATHFGENSDLHEEAKAVEAERADNYQIAVVEMTEQTEVVGDATATTAISGSVTNAPMTGFAPVTISVDGTDQAVTPVETSPPTLPDGSDPASGEVLYNPDTGEINSGTAQDGTGTGTEVIYSTVSWTQALTAVESHSTDIATVANKRYDRSTLGDLSELVMWSDAADITFIEPYLQGGQVGTIAEEQELAADVGSYAPGRLTYPLSNDSSDSLGGLIAGRLGVNDAGYNLFLKSMTANTGSPRYTPSNVGGPGQYGTFEGGSAEDQGSGMSNVLVNSGGAVLTNSLTTAGEQSPYRYLDIGRREAFIKTRAKNLLIGLLRDNDIVFEDGKTIIEETLRSGLRQFAVGEDRMFRAIVPNVPPGLEIPEANRANRLWENITLTLYPTIPVHSLMVDQKMSLERVELAEEGFETTLA